MPGAAPGLDQAAFSHLLETVPQGRAGDAEIFGQLPFRRQRLAGRDQVVLDRGSERIGQPQAQRPALAMETLAQFGDQSHAIRRNSRKSAEHRPRYVLTQPWYDFCHV